MKRQHPKQLKLEFPEIVIIVADENPSCAEEINNRFCFKATIPFLFCEFECKDEIGNLQQCIIILKRKLHLSVGE